MESAAALDALLLDPVAARAVGQLLSAAAAPVEAGPQPGEGAAVAAFRNHHRVTTPVLHVIPSSPLAVVSLPPGAPSSFSPGAAADEPVRSLARTLSSKGLALAVTGGLLLSGGAAAAATGHLPDPAQRTARNVLSKIGVSIPGPVPVSRDKRAPMGPGATSPDAGVPAERIKGTAPERTQRELPAPGTRFPLSRPERSETTKNQERDRSDRTERDRTDRDRRSENAPSPPRRDVVRDTTRGDGPRKAVGQRPSSTRAQEKPLTTSRRTFLRDATAAPKRPTTTKPSSTKTMLRHTTRPKEKHAR